MSSARTSSNARTYDGLLLVNKPLGMTSHDVVQKVRRLIGQRRVGHVGTLDPLATGLLALCLGKGSKIARFLTDYNKTYDAQVRLGVNSKTFDAEGVSDDTLKNATTPSITSKQLDEALSEFVGVTEQRAPIYSAIKVNGQPLYRAARKGEAVEAPIRTVTIESITIKKYDAPHVDLTVKCSKGTYIRSLANDLGERLGCGAYLSKLSRTAIGKLSLDSALSLEDIERLVATDELQHHIISPVDALELPSLVVSDDFATGVAVGLRPGPADIEQVNGQFAAGAYVSLLSLSNTVLAVGVSEVDSHEITVTTKQPIYRHLRVL